MGYLLKDRVARMDHFLGAAEQVASGGTSLDPAVVTQLFGRRRAARDPVASLTPREQEVLGETDQHRRVRAVLAWLQRE